MDDDRKLLELAARAAGIVIGHIRVNGDAMTDSGAWNPLRDDGDALRLAVKLRIAVSVTDQDEDGYSRAIASNWKRYIQRRVTFTDDPYAATRRAIVSVAAALAIKETPNA